MSLSSAVPPTVGGFVLPSVEKFRTRTTENVVVLSVLQFPAASRALTVTVLLPSGKVIVEIAAE